MGRYGGWPFPRPTAWPTSAQTGRSLARPGAASSLYAAAVDESDGSCWADYGGGIRHFAKDGTLLLQIPGPAYTVAVDQATGFCWSWQGPYASVYDKSGNCLWQGGGLTSGRRL